MGLADGLAVGIGMFISIFWSGVAFGFGEAVGICMPGIFICVCGDAAGGICIPGIFLSICGDAEGDACGICIPGMFISIGWEAGLAVEGAADLAG